ncbi:hypothetical protein B5M47_02435 [candidate division CPR3 bacterium 4484_211]|uniref:Ribbon-helix-helix protein CopG domain-containing protein n=1 Tax=candidate division CPR3 bacterium 4484_211 TaxID=1968527 RepID=A0A1W9NY59_UNCC3|nr:MAG: hypothetical protein B5M47_02435 [candidate division CPR3 bacterium 4484_211]
MRRVINISLPQTLANLVEKEVATGQYASKSEFFRNLLRMWIESKALTELEKSRTEFKSEKAKVLRSLKDLR